MSVNQQVVTVNAGLFRDRNLSTRVGGMCDCCGSQVLLNFDPFQSCHYGILFGVGVDVPTTEEYVHQYGGITSYYQNVEWKGIKVQLPKIGVSYNLLIQLEDKPEEDDDEDWDG